MPGKLGCLIGLMALLVGLYVSRQNGQDELVGRVVGGSGFCIVGAMFALLGIGGVRSRLRILSKGERVRGIVVDEVSGSEGTNQIIEWVDREGQSYRKEVCSAKNWQMRREIDLLHAPTILNVSRPWRLICGFSR